MRQSVPDYMTSWRNTLLQILFAALFAYIFINIYRPFGYDNLFSEVDKWKILAVSALVVLSGMIVVLVSRIILIQLKKTLEITYALFTWFIAAEIILMGTFYTTFEIYILNSERTPLVIFFKSVQNTSLILLIPYTLSFLFFAWSDIKKKFETTISQIRNPSDLFIPFCDSHGVLKMSIKSSDLLYLESNDNYVNIHYRDNDKRKKYIIRNSLKYYEKEMKNFPLSRTHRKFSVNVKNVKMLKREGRNYVLVINDIRGDKIPLSKSYEDKILKLLNN